MSCQGAINWMTSNLTAWTQFCVLWKQPNAQNNKNENTGKHLLGERTKKMYNFLSSKFHYWIIQCILRMRFLTVPLCPRHTRRRTHPECDACILNDVRVIFKCENWKMFFSFLLEWNFCKLNFPSSTSSMDRKLFRKLWVYVSPNNRIDTQRMSKNWAIAFNGISTRTFSMFFYFFCFVSNEN